MAEGIKEIVEEWMGNKEMVMLIGELNARVGKWQISAEVEMEASRNTEDKKVSYEGIRLMNLCK